MRIALAGNPNSGKTTMYNALTGSSERVGNWAGVTVDKKEHRIKRSLYEGSEEIMAVDLPGAYSMSPFTSEERITREYVTGEHPDVIINIVDATNLSRSLFLTTQLLELGIPVVVALNKTDANKKKKNKIDKQKLSELLGCRVFETVSTAGEGISELVEAAIAEAGGSVSYLDGFKAASHKDKREQSEADRRRFKFVKSIVSRVETRGTLSSERNLQDKIDAILTNRWAGIPIFALVMLAVFWISQAGPGVWIADAFVGVLERGQELVAELLSNGGELNIWGSILVDGIIGGVIAVVGFLPLVMVMYFLIALLEDSGYMARATVVLDPIFKRVGLSGKSVIPFIIGTGCAVPGVMACRAIRGERERRATAMLAPFMPCGAKLPVISLFAGAFFGRSAFIGASMYFIGILVILLGALLVKLLTGEAGGKNYFIMELPEYKLPSIPRAALSMLQRGKAYIVKAGTVILVCNAAVHIMQSFTPSFKVVAEGAESSSILAIVAMPFAYILAPIVGVVAWQLAAAAITGFIAKENVVGTVAVCYGIANFFNLEDLEMAEGAGAGVAAAIGISKAAALAFLMFNLFSPPCFAAIGAMNSEMKSKKWLLAGISLELAVGYTLGFSVYFFGTLISGESFAAPWIPILGFSMLAIIAATVGFLIIKRRGEIKA